MLAFSSNGRVDVVADAFRTRSFYTAEMEGIGTTCTFIVRMWAEKTGEDRVAWRGCIDDVARKRRTYFTNLGAMCEFIVEQRSLLTTPVG